MKVQDLTVVFGIPPEFLSEGVESYSELRADLIESQRRAEVSRQIIDETVMQPLAKMLLERVIAWAILEVESDQTMKGMEWMG